MGMKRHELGHVSDDAPSRPLSRASRAESIGSLADFSQHASVLPSDMEYSHRYRHPYDGLTSKGKLQFLLRDIHNGMSKTGPSVIYILELEIRNFS